MQNRLETPSRRMFLDFAVLGAIAATIVWWTFQPAFFGDEIGALHVSATHDNAFFATWRDLNSYKPRLLFNAAWAAFGTFGATRLLVAILYGAGLLVCALALCAIGRAVSRPWVLWLASGAALTSRFGWMLHYDYLSGTIEAWSLALLLVALAVLLRAIAAGSRRVGAGTLLAVGLLLLGATLVHERYAAAAMAVGGAIGVVGVYRRVRGLGDGVLLACGGLFIAILPVGVFALANSLLSEHSLLTGTSNREVTFDAGTLVVAGTYLLNVLLGTNFGYPWFVGALNQAHASARLVFGVASVAMATVWTLPLLLRRGVDRHARSWLLFAVAALALVAVASLPGADRQEARWMFPVQFLVVGIVVLVYRAWARIALLMTILLVNGYYVAFGDLSTIVSIHASRLAERTAAALNAQRAGARGLFLQAPEPDTTWVLTGGPFINNDARSAAVFCSLNVRNSACVDPVAISNANARRYDFSLTPVPGAGSDSLWLDAMTGGALDAMRDPSRFGRTGGEVVGGEGAWTRWRWVAQPAEASGMLDLPPGSEGNVPVPVVPGMRQFLVYRAAAAGQASTLAMQVIWAREGDVIIGAEGAASALDAWEGNHVMVVHPPSGATMAYVYAMVPGTAAGGARLRSVRLVAAPPSH